MQKGLNLQMIKQSNRASILYLLNEKGAMSRKQIALSLGLTKAALTKITANLLLDGAIVECESVGNGVGRKEVLLKLNYGDFVALGITFERDEITLSISKLNGELVDKLVIDFTEDFTTVKNLIKVYYLKNSTVYNFIGTGVSIIGLSNDYGVFKDIDIKNEIEQIVNMPVFVKNNVQAFSLAETLYGNINNEKNVLMFKWGPGIGSSFIREGKVLSGDDNGVAEIGHMIVNPNGKKCRCGRIGCLETETALDVITADVNKLGYSLSIEEILKSTNEDIVSLLDKKISMVSLALLNASTILNASKIVLFGSVFNNKDFLDRFLKCYKEFVPYSNNQTIAVSNLNDKQSFIGSTAMVSTKLFFERYL